MLNQHKFFLSFFLILFSVFSSGQVMDTASYDDPVAIDKKRLEKQDYIPSVHGTIRGKYEYSPTIAQHRFQVRNARVSVTGNVLPIVAYKAEIDLSDAGRMRMLDAYVRVFPVKGLQVSIGQMKIPFSTENLRSPHNIFFANRSFIAKQVTGLRDVGLLLGYEFKEVVPFQLFGGVYNGSGIYEQSGWQSTFDLAARLVVQPASWFNVALNVKRVKPESLQMMLYDVSAFSDFYGWHLEAEYLYKTYQKNVLQPTQAFVGFVSYELALPKVFRSISFLARYDMMTANQLGYISTSGTYEMDDVARQRLTYGVTLSMGKKNQFELRINYEDYYYQNWRIGKQSEQDKLVVEIMARF